MEVVFTDAATADLEAIARHLAADYPEIAPAVGRRIELVLARIGRWPQSSRRVAERPDVRVAALVRYPYNIFYRLTDDAVEVLHVSHTSGRPPTE